MMMTESSIYWITRLDYLHGLAFFLAFLFGVMAFALLIMASVFHVNEDENFTNIFLFRLAPFSALIAAIMLLAGVFIPTTREMAMIKVIPALANSEMVQKTIPAEAKEIYALAKYALTKTIKEEK